MTAGEHSASNLQCRQLHFLQHVSKDIFTHHWCFVLSDHPLTPLREIKNKIVQFKASHSLCYAAKYKTVARDEFSLHDLITFNKYA